MRTPPPPSRFALRDENGSMAFYLVIAVVGMALAALLMPMIVTSSTITRSNTSRVHALDAAQSGLNVAVGNIRSATTIGVGTTSKLPCAPFAGNVSGPSQATYATSIAYYIDDPTTVPGATKMRCVPGYGTYDSISGAFTPRFARITSVGKDGPARNGSTQGRTLQATYVFRVTNSNIVGGPIRIYPDSVNPSQMCMDAGSPTPIAGASLLLQVCASPPTNQQLFAYRSDLTLQLLSSVTSAYQNGLCLDMADKTSASSPIVFAECEPLGSPPYSQQWSFNDNGNFQAANQNSATNGGLAGQCIYVGSQNPGQLVTLGGCSTTSSPNSAWIPSPAAGPGGAQAPQLINFYEFGRCLDVTGQNVNFDHLIAYPCKQNPFRGAVAWNQKFTLPTIASGATTGTGRISTNNGGGDYCLTSPGTSGAYVVMRTCDGSAAQTWTVYSGSSSLTYSAKYQIVDSGGACLGLTDAAAGETWSAIDVEPCTGATEQKWNAAADLTSSALRDTREIATP